MERDATSTTNEKTYPRWLWRIADEFDRWAANRLPMVQDMILESVGNPKLPKRTEKEAEAVAHARLNTARALDKELKRGPFKTKRAEKKRQEKIKRLRSEHFCSGKGVVSDDKPRSPADKVAYLARVHDVMVEKDAGRRRRKRWAPVAPKLSDDAQGVAQEIDFVTLFAVESIPQHVEDHNATGSSEIERCWQEVQDEVAALEGATAGSDTGQPVDDVDKDKTFATNPQTPEPTGAEGIMAQAGGHEDDNAAPTPPPDEASDDDDGDGPTKAGMTVKQILEAIGIGKTTLHDAMKAAKITKHGKGEHDKPSSPHQISRIARARAESTRFSSDERQRWEGLLKELGQPKLDEPLSAKRR